MARLWAKDGKILVLGEKTVWTTSKTEQGSQDSRREFIIGGCLQRNDPCIKKLSFEQGGEIVWVLCGVS